MTEWPITMEDHMVVWHSSFILLDFYPGYPYSRNFNGIEITAIRFISLPQGHIFGMYESPNVSLRQMRQRFYPDWNTNTPVFLPGQFGVFIWIHGNWLKNSEGTSLHDLFVKDHRYNLLISCKTTNHKASIDHIYTNNIPEHFKVEILESIVSELFRFYR